MAGNGVVLGRFAEPVIENTVRIALLSDLHLSPDDRGTWRVSHRTEERLRSTVTSLNQQDPDVVLFVGDLVHSGAKEQFDAFDRIITDVEAPFVAIPGNHDLRDAGPQRQLTREEFERRYTPGTLPFRKQIGDVDLIGLNSNRSTRGSLAESHEGRISPRTIEWLEETLETSSHPLVAIHHALPGAREKYRKARNRLPTDVSGVSPGVENDDRLVDVLNSHDVALVITGHLHFPAIGQMRSLRELTLPALGPYQNSYTMLEMTESGTTARLHSIADFHERIDSLVHGREKDRVLLAAAQLAGLPLVEDFEP